MVREYKNKIGLAGYECKEKSITAYLIEEKVTGKRNLLVPPLKGRVPKEDTPTFLFALTKNKASFTITLQPNTMIEVLAGEKEPPRKEFFELIEVTPVAIDELYHTSLTITAPDVLLRGPANYLMAILREKRKATESEINAGFNYDFGNMEMVRM